MDIDDTILTSNATANSLSVLGNGSASSAAAHAAALTELSEVSVRFVTRNPALPQVPNTFLSVPVRLARYGLSEIVNALTQVEPARPFDFLIGGRFLRGSLLAHLTRTGSSGEGGLEIEYVEALPEPSSAPSRPHPDWIAAIDARLPGGQHVLTACYDSVVRMYDAKDVAAAPVATGVGHTSAVKSVAAFKLVPGAGAQVGAAAAAQGFKLATGSKDRSVRVWQYTPGQAALKCVAQCVGHTDSVEAVATAPGSGVFASGGWDHTIRMWDVTNADTALPASETDAPAPKKARKNAAAALPAIPSFSPLQTLQSGGHTQAVTTLVYPHPAALYSGAMDHNILQWDVESGAVAHTWYGTRAINALAFSPLANVLASAHNDGVIRVWDPRSNQVAKDAVQGTLKSHKLWASALAFNPSSAHQLASVAYDHTVKVWDLRASLPLFTLRAHTDKLMAVDWIDGEHIISGGADKQLQTHTMGKTASVNADK